MTDVFSEKKRSEIMSKIRSKDTKLEILVLKELRKRKIYFHKYHKIYGANIDIAKPRGKLAVFIDGDFWHGWKFNRSKSRLPKKYWLDKIENNIKRDKRNKARLKRGGWRVMRVWEHKLKEDFEGQIKRIVKFFKIILCRWIWRKLKS